MQTSAGIYNIPNSKYEVAQTDERATFNCQEK